jgi:hypothetical protein
MPLTSTVAQATMFRNRPSALSKAISTSYGGGVAAPAPVLDRATGGGFEVGGSEPSSGPSRAVMVAAGVVGIALVGFVVYRLKRKG